MHKICGRKSDIDSIMTLDATYLTLTFKSDSSVTRRGFDLTYKIVSRKGMIIRELKTLKTEGVCD